jgi:hypothetical protein
MVDPELSRALALRAIRGNLLRLKWQAAALRFEMALGRHDRALKYGYHPDQPRVPARNPNGGQWTSEAGAGSSGGKQPARTAQAGFGVLVAGNPVGARPQLRLQFWQFQRRRARSGQLLMSINQPPRRHYAWNAVE